MCIHIHNNIYCFNVDCIVNLMNTGIEGTLPIVPNITTETISSRKMNISWTPALEYNHFVTIFDGSSITLHYDLGNSTLFDNLNNLEMYLVIVMAYSEDSYGGIYSVHLQEAGTDYTIY